MDCNPFPSTLPFIKALWKGQFRVFRVHDYNSLQERLYDLFNIESSTDLCLKYVDNEDDLITFSTPEEFETALLLAEHLTVSTLTNRPLATIIIKIFVCTQQEDAQYRQGLLAACEPQQCHEPTMTALTTSHSPLGATFNTHHNTAPAASHVATAHTPHPVVDHSSSSKHHKKEKSHKRKDQNKERASSPPMCVEKIVDQDNTEKEKRKEKKKKKQAKQEAKERLLADLNGFSTAFSAKFLKDITLPGESTTLLPCTKFTKTWLVKNDSTIEWPQGCHLRYIGAEPPTQPHLPDVTVVPIQGAVPGGAEMELSVYLTTPHNMGRYKYFWKLSTKDGVKFGERLIVAFNVADLDELHTDDEEAYSVGLDKLAREGFAQHNSNLQVLQQVDGKVDAAIKKLQLMGLQPLLACLPSSPPTTSDDAKQPFTTNSPSQQPILHNNQPFTTTLPTQYHHDHDDNSNDCCHNNICSQECEEHSHNHYPKREATVVGGSGGVSSSNRLPALLLSTLDTSSGNGSPHAVPHRG